MPTQEPANPENQGRGIKSEPDTGFPRAIGRPATSALHAAGYTHLDQLASVPDSELLALHGFGPKAMRIIRETLAANVAERSSDEGG